MKACVVIPCFNHAGTVADVAKSAQAFAPVIVVDDGSAESPPALPGVTLLHFERNRGKAAALRAGFARATELGFTHAITMDSDRQHFAEDLPKFLSAAQLTPDALIVGVRDLAASGAPRHRQRSNKASNFGFRTLTGIRLKDTQCGFRCYPLALTNKLKTGSERFAFELEFMVRAAWTGTSIVAVPVRCSYQPEQMARSNFRPVVDLARIVFVNFSLAIQSWLIPKSLLASWSLGQKLTLRQTLHDFFAEHARDPVRMSLAVGLGLFCGIAPIWGYQMVAAVVCAHWFRLNKAIAVLASNISIPPVMPFILYGGLALGHWIFTGQSLTFSLPHMTRTRALEYLWQWCVGSLVLGFGVAVVGTLITYTAARMLRRR